MCANSICGVVAQIMDALLWVEILNVNLNTFGQLLYSVISVAHIGQVERLDFLIFPLGVRVIT